MPRKVKDSSFAVVTNHHRKEEGGYEGVCIPRDIHSYSEAEAP